MLPEATTTHRSIHAHELGLGGGTLIVNSQNDSADQHSRCDARHTPRHLLEMGLWEHGSNLYTYQVVTPRPRQCWRPIRRTTPSSRCTIGAGKVLHRAPICRIRRALLIKAHPVGRSDHRQGWVRKHVDYLTTRARVPTVTVVSNSGNTWTGMSRPCGLPRARMAHDQSLSYTTTNGVTTIAGTVPPYDVRVFALTGGSTDTEAPPAPTNLQIR
jgi:hypothetical protein